MIGEDKRVILNSSWSNNNKLPNNSALSNHQTCLTKLTISNSIQEQQLIFKGLFSHYSTLKLLRLDSKASHTKTIIMSSSKGSTKASQLINLTTCLRLSLSFMWASPSPHTTMAQLSRTSSRVRLCSDKSFNLKTVLRRKFTR